jgi:hypothetical protein
LGRGGGHAQDEGKSGDEGSEAALYRIAHDGRGGVGRKSG